MLLHSRQEPDRVDSSSGGGKSNDGRLSCGFSSLKGRRLSMEDFYDIKALTIGGETVYLFGVFDGHGGSHAAEYLKKHLFDNLMKHPKFMTDTNLAIRESYKQTDTDFLEAEINAQRDDGSTASTAILIGNHLYIANVGDSRAVISKAGEAVQLSEDHKPNRTDERKRIENAGGVVMWAGTWRVGGVLAMSRAFGDRLLKQFVVPDPEIQVESVDEGLEFLILASDGLWDYLDNQEAVRLVTSESEPVDAARKLTDTALVHGSGDNITCIVVKFHHNDTTAPTTSAGSAGCSYSGSSTPYRPLTAAEIFSPKIAVDSSSSGTVDVPAPTSVAGSSTGSGVSLLRTNAAGTSFSSSAGSADALHATVADSSAATVGLLLDTMAAGSPSVLSLDTTPPAMQDCPSVGTALFLPSTGAAGSS